jgi:excinuclease ABC subunit B
VNLLREGLIYRKFLAILDADKRISEVLVLTQTIGRAARNLNGKAMYADKITNSMQKTIDETTIAEPTVNYNTANNLTPQALTKKIESFTKTRDYELNSLNCRRTRKPVPI